VAPSIDATIAFYAIIGGIVPALVWLFFWLNEDCHPEPKRLILLAFVAGMLAIPAALLGETLWEGFVNTFFTTLAFANIMMIVGFSFIEELVKWILIHLTIFWRRAYDEPVDAMIYLVTGALGFAALENILYLLPEFHNSLFLGITTGNLRFIGATLLHALSSGVLGFFIAHNFCNSRVRKFFGTIIGLLLATLLHAIFNVVILMNDASSLMPIVILLGLSGIFLIFGFDHIKRIHQVCIIKHKRGSGAKNIIAVPHPRETV